MSDRNLKKRRRESTLFTETDALSNLLEDLSIAYTGNRKNVIIKEEPHSPFDMGEGDITVNINIRDEIDRPLTGPNKLRYIIDELSHTIEHKNETSFDIYKDLVQSYDNEYEKVIAATIASLVEDQYVDTNRIKKHRGHRRSVAFKRALYMRDSLRPPLSDLKRESALVEGTIQVILSGYAKEAESLRDTDIKYLNWVKEAVEKARVSGNKETRRRIVTNIADQLNARVSSNPNRAQAHVFDNYPPTYDLEPLIRDEEVDESQEEGLKSKLNDMKSKLENMKDKATGNPQNQPDDLEDVDLDDFDEESEIEGDSDLDGDMDSEAPSQSDSSTQNSQSDSIDDMENEGEGKMSIEEPDSSGGMPEISEQEIGEMYGLDSDEEYIEPSERAKERFESLKRAAVKEQLGDLPERIKERDKRIDSNESDTNDIQNEVRKRGLVDEVVDMFYRLKTRDRDVRATKGRRVNERAVERNLSGNYSEQKLFFKRQRAETGDRAVGVSVDLSGSMDAEEAMVALGTLAEAIDIIGDDLVATRFNGQDSSLITGPEEEFNWEHIKSVRSGGKTPTAYGILDTQLLLDECTKREKVLFVITDGKPNVGIEEMSSDAVADATQQVREARKNSTKVIGLGLSGVNKSQMEQIFGPDNYIMVEEDRLAEDLLTVYRNQMNVA